MTSHVLIMRVVLAGKSWTFTRPVGPNAWALTAIQTT
jgi:hypothetical protein